MRSLLLVAAITGTPTVGTQSIKVEPAAVQIVRKTYGESFKGLTPFNSQKPGTAMVLIMEDPNGGFIEISTTKSKLTSFTDNKGTNLIEKTRFNNEGLGSFPKISDDGKAGMFEIKGNNLPARGAVAVKAKGKLVVLCATKKKQFKSKPFKMKVGETITVGKAAFLIKKVGKPAFGDSAVEISLEAKRDLNEIAEFRFEDTAGKAIKSKPGGTSRFAFNDSVTVTKSHGLARKVDQCVMILDIWIDMHEVDVPFDVTAGIGG